MVVYLATDATTEYLISNNLFEHQQHTCAGYWSVLVNQAQKTQQPLGFFVSVPMPFHLTKNRHQFSANNSSRAQGAAGGVIPEKAADQYL